MVLHPVLETMIVEIGKGVQQVCFALVSERFLAAPRSRTTQWTTSEPFRGRTKTRAHCGILIPNAGMRRGLRCRRKTGGIRQYGQRFAARQSCRCFRWRNVLFDQRQL